MTILLKKTLVILLLLEPRWSSCDELDAPTAPNRLPSVPATTSAEINSSFSSDISAMQNVEDDVCQEESTSVVYSVVLVPQLAPTSEEDHYNSTLKKAIGECYDVHDNCHT
jgi:hypothetical protein